MKSLMSLIAIVVGIVGCGTTADQPHTIAQSVEVSGGSDVEREATMPQHPTTLVRSPVPLVAAPVIVSDTQPNHPRAGVAVPAPASGVVDVSRSPAVSTQSF